ncbi:MAG: hypothetical protein J3R72DRAFT_460627 [Linnemannia gamsii]|nr:MAG: hypothetical protein J3R72DRAFT_460627 [Linnemannia gamsii]
MAEENPNVLIVGAGLGGLLLGALLERASIPYTIFERTSVVKPLGSGILIGPNILSLFDQLGIMDEFVALGKNTIQGVISKDNVGPVLTISHILQKELSGYYSYNIARPVLYELLLKQVPTHKVLFNKRVLKVTEEDNKVKIQTADNSEYEGDILVGADGAYSAVRQRIYEALDKEGKLPKSDQEELPFSCTCLVGQTNQIDMNLFPEFKGEEVPFYNTMSADKPFTWVIGVTAQETVTWMMMHHLDGNSSKAAEEHRFRGLENSEWGPLAAEAMCDETRNFPLPIGTKKMTMGDMYDLTPKEQISKVMLEEKVFNTWYSGRTVLLGDACHKLNPAGAHGAVTSMHDAIALANLIYALPSSPTTAEIEQAFFEYQAERFPHVMNSFKSSQMMAKFMNRNMIGSFALFIMRVMPQWMWKIVFHKMVQNRPTCGWMKEIEERGTVPADVSPSTEKARAVYKKRQESAVSM